MKTGDIVRFEWVNGQLLTGVLARKTPVDPLKYVSIRTRHRTFNIPFKDVKYVVQTWEDRKLFARLEGAILQLQREVQVFQPQYIDDVVSDVLTKLIGD